MTLVSNTSQKFINVIQKPLISNSWDRDNTQLGIFEGKQYIIFDYYADPYDGQMLACISAMSKDVACCEINFSGYFEPLAVPDPCVWSLVGSISGRIVPDYFRYVVLDRNISHEVFP